MLGLDSRLLLARRQAVLAAHLIQRHALFLQGHTDESGEPPEACGLGEVGIGGQAAILVAVAVAVVAGCFFAVPAEWHEVLPAM